MKINIFKNDGKQIFTNLEVCNQSIQEAYDIYVNIGNVESTWWFNPKEWKAQESVQRNPKDKPSPRQTLLRQNQLNYAENYNICLYPPNYLTIFLINKLYPTQKDILIEDCCAGDGRLFIFLTKCGYTNFSAIEDFSQISKCLFDGMMAYNNIRYVLNVFNTSPIIVNQAGYPVCPKKSIANSVELVCTYANQHLEHLMNDTILKKEYTELCTDYNDISIAWCRNDKYNEFSKILAPYMGR